MNTTDCQIVIDKILERLVFKSKDVDLTLDVIKNKNHDLLSLYQTEKEFIDGLISVIEQDIINPINEELSYHDGIRESDEQYEDPYEWWSRPVVRKSKELLETIGEIYSDRDNTYRGLECMVLYNYTEKEAGIYEFAIPFYWLNDIRRELELIKEFE